MSAASAWQGVADSHSPLISAEQLNALLGDPTVKIFDVRGTWSTPARALPEDYAAGHIEGAVFLDWTQHFNAQDVPIGLAQLAGESAAKASFAKLGIHADDLVVLYDASAHMLAGRMWLAMRHWGFRNVRVLNGGWSYWQALDLPMSTKPTAPGIGTYQPCLHQGLKIDLDAFLSMQADACVLDARGAEGFNGKAEDPRTGHIPDSVNVPFRAVLDSETGLFLQDDEIVSTLHDLAPEWQRKPIIASCGSGYAATVILLALAKIGSSGTLFDGSFAVWKQDPNRQVAQGSL